jgi:hypothetical protein
MGEEGLGAFYQAISRRRGDSSPEATSAPVGVSGWLLRISGGHSKTGLGVLVAAAWDHGEAIPRSRSKPARTRCYLAPTSQTTP